MTKMLQPPPGYRYVSEDEAVAAGLEIDGMFDVPQPCDCVFVEPYRRMLHIYRCGSADSAADQRILFLRVNMETGYGFIADGIHDLDQLIRLMTEDARHRLLQGKYTPQVIWREIEQIEEPSAYEFVSIPRGYRSADEDELETLNQLFPAHEWGISEPYQCVLRPPRRSPAHQNETRPEDTYIYYCGLLDTDLEDSEANQRWIAWKPASGDAYLLEGFSGLSELLSLMVEDEDWEEGQPRKISWKKLERTKTSGSDEAKA